jgi:hypothetical protein
MTRWPWVKLASANADVCKWLVHFDADEIAQLPSSYRVRAELVRDEMNRRGLQPHLF